MLNFTNMDMQWTQRIEDLQYVRIPLISLSISRYCKLWHRVLW